MKKQHTKGKKTEKNSGQLDKKVALSVCMIVKNEEKLLPQCLQSIKPVADEIVIVDTGSTDRTIEIAKNFGAKVYEHPWQKNFSLHRNQSLSYATGDWILQIDADEELQPESAEILLETIRKAPNKINGYTVVIQDYRKDKLQGLVFNYPRLYRNGIGVYYEGIVHNQVVIPGNIGFSKVVLNHYGYDLDRKVMLKKFKRSVSLLKKMAKESPGDPSPFFYLANAYSQYKKHKKCILYSRKTLELLRTLPEAPPFYLSIYHALITSLIALKKFDEAEKAARESILVKEDYLDGYYHLSAVCYMQQNFSDSVQFGRKYLHLLEEYRKNPERYFNLNIYTLERQHRFKYWFGVSLFALGQEDEGRKSIEWALNHPFGKDYMAIEAAHNVIVVAGEKQGKALFEKMYEKFCHSGDFVLMLAHEFATLDRFIWLQEQMEKEPPGNVDGFGMYGEALMALLQHDHPGAQEKVNQLLSEQPEHLYGLALSDILNTEVELNDLDLIQNPSLYLKIYSFIVDTSEIFSSSPISSAKLLNLENASGLSQKLSEIQIIKRLMGVLKSIQNEDPEGLVSELLEIGSFLKCSFSNNFEDISQILVMLAEITKKADLIAYPDAGNVALSIASLYFPNDIPLQALYYKRRIFRAKIESAFAPWVRIIFKYLFPRTRQLPSSTPKSLQEFKKNFKRIARVAK